MKKTSRLTALSMCAAIVLCASSCGGTNTGKPAEAATTTTATEATTTSNTLDDDLKNPVDIQEFVDDEATLENPNLTYLGFYDMRTAGDIKPGVKLFEETYGGKIDYYQVAWGERIDKLQMLISSGDSPDLVDKEDIAFPLLISKNVYEDLTDYIDLSQPQWDGFQDLIERYAWNGKRVLLLFDLSACEGGKDHRKRYVRLRTACGTDKDKVPHGIPGLLYTDGTRSCDQIRACGKYR